MIDGSSSFVVTSTCSDAYVAVLAFPATVDYRADISRAVYNSAFPCTASGTVVTATITPSDLGATPSGTYYYFTADQGTSGMWYNPR